VGGEVGREEREEEERYAELFAVGDLLLRRARRLLVLSLPCLAHQLLCRDLHISRLLVHYLVITLMSAGGG